MSSIKFSAHLDTSCPKFVHTFALHTVEFQKCKQKLIFPGRFFFNLIIRKSINLIDKLDTKNISFFLYSRERIHFSLQQIFNDLRSRWRQKYK
jgi:hypothetical protein